jgi:hypothetical protein
VRLHDHPGLCSRCFLSKVNVDGDKPYVDFQVFWDGPVIPAPPSGNFDPDPPATIDDLFLCFDCLSEAAKLIGFGDVSAMQAELAAANEELLTLRKERLDAVKRLDAVESAFEGRQKPVKARSTASKKTSGAKS